MKTIPFISLFLLLICFSSFAQNEVILLRPETGKEYIYQFNKSIYHQSEDGEKLNEFLWTKILEIEYRTTEPDNKKLLFVTVSKNTLQKPGEIPFAYRDYEYPEFQNEYYGGARTDAYENLVCNILFKYEFNEETSELKLYNRDEVLLAAKKRLDKKAFDQVSKNRQIEAFNTKAIPQITKSVQLLFQVKSEMLDPQKYDVDIATKDHVLSVTNQRWDEKPGLYTLNYSINDQEKFLREYQSISLDSTKHSRFINGNYYSLFYNEESIKLLNLKEKTGTRLIVSGTVSGVINKKVTLAILRNPYGTELYQETVFLDESNTFHIETELENPGLVFLLFGQSNSSAELPTISLYAEPGSNIHLIANGEFPWDVEFSGDFAAAQELLCNFNKEYEWLEQRMNFNSIYWWWSSNMKFVNLRDAIDNFDVKSMAYKEAIPAYVFDFVRNELKANLMCGVLEFLSTWEYKQRVNWGQVYFPDEDIVDLDYLNKVLNEIEIHEIYNANGVFSRQFANSYLSYYLQTVKKVRSVNYFGFEIVSTPSNELRFYGDLPNKIEIAKALLAGPALYGQIAEMLLQEKTTIYNQESEAQIYRKNEVEKYLDLMLRLCNDPGFSQSLEGIISTQSEWDKKDYVPNTKFFNEKGEAKYLKDFLGNKPALFYVTKNWSKERYYFDELAKENPEINFVLVTEGSNIQEWMDYTKRANPVAYQLFLINHKVQLGSIFKSGKGHFIAYDKDGVRIGFDRNMVSGMNLCKQSLQPKKKELNKSQLQIIIVVLLSILTILIIGLLLWKWRVRRQFRKEEQKRRLRELELTAIRSQMNPHFLFNSLNSVQNLVQQNKGREAHLYLSDFAGLIRKVLNNSEKEEVSLAEELELIRQYLNLEKLRFDFEFEVLVDETIDAHNTQVPSLLLQPFVENAIVHGLQNKRGEKHLKIDVMKKDAFVLITITDNGIGRKAAKEIQQQKNGKGTKLMKERLEILQQKQGEKYALTTTDLEEGTRVEIILPEEK
ncbi:histidine kinase [Draconibacterium orientale]|uniref:sensor histidine kinase n=1 Tax=Draconibacterium orientale TaxID=1168034 RepID=UPI002ABE749E|nr:histidine kinase [Draconibacterium orientale]